MNDLTQATLATVQHAVAAHIAAGGTKLDVIEAIYPGVSTTDAVAAYRDQSINILELPLKVYNTLTDNKIKTIGELFDYDDLLYMPGIGRTFKSKISHALADKCGVTLKG